MLTIQFRSEWKSIIISYCLISISITHTPTNIQLLEFEKEMKWKKSHASLKNSHQNGELEKKEIMLNAPKIRFQIKNCNNFLRKIFIWFHWKQFSHRIATVRKVRTWPPVGSKLCFYIAFRFRYIDDGCDFSKSHRTNIEFLFWSSFIQLS